jgi:hypothetical protein
VRKRAQEEKYQQPKLSDSVIGSKRTRFAVHTGAPCLTDAREHGLNDWEAKGAKMGYYQDRIVISAQSLTISCNWTKSLMPME